MSERLTDTTGQLFACGNSLCAFEPQQLCSDCKYQHEANKRLAAYENIMTKPENLDAELTELLAYRMTGLSPAEVAELARAKEQGRLLLPPSGSLVVWQLEDGKALPIPLVTLFNTRQEAEAAQEEHEAKFEAFVDGFIGGAALEGGNARDDKT